MRISDWSSDVCSSDLGFKHARMRFGLGRSFYQTDTRLSLRQVGLALVGRSQAIGNFLTALVHCFRHGRPYEFHRKPAQNEKHDHLKKESRVYVHSRFPLIPRASGTICTQRPSSKPAAARNSAANGRLTRAARGPSRLSDKRIGESEQHGNTNRSEEHTSELQSLI